MPKCQKIRMGKEQDREEFGMDLDQITNAKFQSVKSHSDTICKRISVFTVKNIFRKCREVFVERFKGKTSDKNK